MFKLENDREFLYQWDIDQRLTVNDPDITEAHFSNGVRNDAIVCKVYEEDGKRFANIPNVLLQTARPVNVYAFLPDYTKTCCTFSVSARPKPEDYVYTEAELNTWQSLDARLKTLEQGGGAGGITPHIGENGNWWIGEEDTGTKAMGKSPVLGVDYWTDGDREILFGDCQSYIQGELVKRGQLKPQFASTVDECTDTTKLYVLPDGFIYAYMESETVVSAGKNELAGAVGYLGTVLNGVGYIDDYYISGTAYVSGNDSYLSTSQDATHFITGFMPYVVREGEDTEPIYVRGITLDLNALNSHTRLSLFPDYNFEESNSPKNFADLVSAGVMGIEQLGEQYYRITFTDAFFNYLNSNVKTQGANYIRFSLPGSGEGVLIQFGEAKTDIVITEGWNNTGHAFVPADYENRIIGLETVALKNSKDISELEAELANLSGSSATDADIPDYWRSHLEVKAVEISKAMQEAGRNKSAFLWYTDAHWTDNYKNSPALLKYLHQNTPINKINFGGDVVQDEPKDDSVDDTVEMGYVYDWRKSVRELPNHHSVVGNHDDGIDPDHRFTDEWVYSFLLAPEESNDVVMGDGIYYYIDDKAEKTRYLYLDTVYREATASQIAFVINALNTAPENWHIVAIAHAWHYPKYTEELGDYIDGYYTGAVPFLQLFYAYNHRQSGADFDFTNASGCVEFCIGGHAHKDYADYYEDELLIITTDTDSATRSRSGVPVIVDTVSESVVNAVVADYGKRRVSVIRVGRGENMILEIKR